MADTVKHTPGPWHVKASRYEEGRILVQECMPTKRVLADFGSEMGPLDAIDIANAHLIAAAPDLLDAVKDLLDAYSKPDERLCCDGRDCGCMGSTVHQLAEHYARAAIAKAEGRS